MRLSYEGLGAEYLYSKAMVGKTLSYEDDLRALLAQYTGDEATLELFRATKLARYLPPAGERLEPGAVERAALRYYMDALETLRGRTPGYSEAVYHAYRLVVVARDVELIARRRLQGEAPPSPGELIHPEAPETAAARRQAEEGADPAAVLAAAGMSEAAKLLQRARDAKLLSVAVELELLQAFNRARRAVRTEAGREIVGARQDIYAARAAATLVAASIDKSTVSLYTSVLDTYKLPRRKLIDAIEASDAESVENILLEAAGTGPSEGLSALEAFIASRRRENRASAKTIFIREPLSLDVVAGFAELFLLDAEDAIAIALAGYSRQPKSIVTGLLSF
ncbi:hypothetical protein CF15_05230 [Pyrodictium occultum]|uniref:V-type ATP synthase subunit C n=1 Tax=Pyrodictium occultum TaxID=2309 RepID=A0A0V8RVT8_PYROC|nr:hypothetical protein [Pyrodictium occultum]KSW12165.1 hypothetical protein CF15_05230 [Pyrodictium occultum]